MISTTLSFADVATGFTIFWCVALPLLAIGITLFERKPVVGLAAAITD